MRLLRPVVGVLVVGVLIAAVMSPASASVACQTTQAVTAPGANVRTMGQIVQYFESQGFTAIAAAGIVGNLVQESGLNPKDPGGGLAQWNPSWYGTMSAWASSHGLDSSSMQGQLAYLAFDIKTSYPGMFKQMNAATDPGTAALLFMDGYEQCSGAGPRGGTSFTPGSLCNAPNRQSQAATALKAAGNGGAGLSVSAPLGATASCAAAGLVSANGTSNPAPGATWGRLDMGFDGDYNMAEGVHAPYSGTIGGIGISGWPGQGVYFAIQNDDQSGPDYTRAMYFAEGATPLFPNGTHVTAGQKIGDAVQSGGDSAPGNFEIGPANTSNFDCLAKSYGLNSPGSRGMVMAFYAYMRTLGAGATTNPAAAGGP